MSEDLDRWLEEELRLLAANTAPPPAPRYARHRPVRSGWRLRAASVPAALGAKLLIGASAVALAAAAGVGVKTAVTGNPNPLDWSHGAEPVVQTCTASLAPSPGFGPCVSAQVTVSPPGAGHRRTPTPSPAASSRHSPGAHPTGREESSSQPTPLTSRGDSGDHPTPAASPRSSAHPTPPPHPTPNGASRSHSAG